MVKFIEDILESARTIAAGMGITFKYLGKRPVTQQYPDERWSLPDRFRGFVHNDVPRCTACLACAKHSVLMRRLMSLEMRAGLRQLKGVRASHPVGSERTSWWIRGCTEA